jgi:predicted nucleotidyltransferase
MKIVGIVAEYNPFHTGHAYHIRATKALLGSDAAVLCAMSGNWVQRGEGAIADKWTRTELALRGGVDLVLELPTVWASSSAEGFAMGAAALLDATGVVDTLSFGSESGSLDKLQTAADCLLTEEYRQALAQLLETGMAFAAARQRAAISCIGAGAACLASPNNNLAVEYLKALRRLDSHMIPMTVPRQGAGHDADEAAEGFTSAGALRKMLLEGRWTQAEPYLPDGGAQLLKASGLACLDWCERGVLARLKTLSPSDFAQLPDSGEGLCNRLADAALRGCSLEEIYTLAKTKRYAHSRVRRLVLWAFLGLTAADRPERPLYVRVLGMNERGQTVNEEVSSYCAVAVTLITPTPCSAVSLQPVNL